MAFYLFVLLLVSVSLILIIHNSFAVSMNARVHQFGIFSSIGAVSYTHLDVYKRQANSKPWERFIFLSVPNEKIVPYQLIFTENEIELWA